MREFHDLFARHGNVASIYNEDGQSNAAEEEEPGAQVERRSEERFHADNDTVKSGKGFTFNFDEINYFLYLIERFGNSYFLEYEKKVPRILNPVALDSTQEKALSVLFELKVCNLEN